MAGINADSEIDNVYQSVTNLEVDVFAEAEMFLNIKIPASLKNLLKAGFEKKWF